MNILEILAKRKVISAIQAESIDKEATKSGQSVETVLVKKGINPDIILAVKGEFFDVPTRTLGPDENIPRETLMYIPEDTVIRYKVAPLAVKDSVLEVGVVDPDTIEVKDVLSFISTKIGLPFKLFIVTEEDFQKILKMYKGISGEVTQALDELETEAQKEIKNLGVEVEAGTPADEEGENESGPEIETKIIEDAPVTKIVATILRYATEGGASDVHIEHMRDNVRVRFRVDGVLNTSLVLPVKVHPAVVARIKILSSMRLDEKRKPQDGRFSAKIEGRKIDFRVSTFPSYFGEKVVMRILDQEKGVKKLDDMGLTPENLALIREALNKPYGLILISGPTGSGKSTTLYSMLNEMDRETENILSLEDPVEYCIEGVSQSQMRPEIGYTFATGLRTTLRQDPDVIMVGEIRDKETAQLAVQAALTGHLVLSTIHTNNAIGVIPRLIDMGIDPYLIAPTLILTIAQRLVSLLPEGGGEPTAMDGSIKMMIDKQFEDLPEEIKKKITYPAEIMQIKPTPDCPTGTRGRIGVYELFKMDKNIEKIILTNPVDTEIYKVIRESGMLTMREDAILKAFAKKIPFEEVNKL
ncbi:MAG: GspE/PulE family protein [Candidatus Paceibacterota bacterium]|jgi:type IV pilus assembly protein PilB